MKPFSVVTVPGYASRPLKPIEMALLAAMLLENGMAAHAPFAVTRMAKCCLASWMGRAFFTHERRGFTDRLILNTAWGLAREGRLLVSQDQGQRIALTADGRLAASCILNAFDPPLTAAQFKDMRAGSMFARTGRFAP